MIEHKDMDVFNAGFSGRAFVYAGFDPTADGLHLGSMSILAVLKDMADAGHHICAVVGTGTGKIGDPTGKSSARSFIEPEQLKKNVEGLKRDIHRVLPEAEIIENNWFSDITIDEFMVEVMKHIPLTKLLGLSIVKDRLDSGSGISLMEAIYPVFQGWDMVMLSDRATALGLDMVIQVGGQDQTGNMSMGLHLLNRVREDRKADMLSVPLITTANGEKMGKSAGNALWLAPEKLDDVQFFDGILSIPDEILEDSSNILTHNHVFVGDILQKKQEFAKTVFIKVRGQEAFDRMLLVKNGTDLSSMPKVELAKDFQQTFVDSGLCSSRGEVMRMIKNSGLKVNGNKVSDIMELNIGDIISCGKRKVCVV